MNANSKAATKLVDAIRHVKIAMPPRANPTDRLLPDSILDHLGKNRFLTTSPPTGADADTIRGLVHQKLIDDNILIEVPFL